MKQSSLHEYFSKQNKIGKEEVIPLKEEKKQGQNKKNSKQNEKDKLVQISKEKSQDKIPPIIQKKTNVQFYTNKRVSQPGGDNIDNIQKKWWGNYNLLEAHHGFIQWLFPNAFQSRFNPKAFPLSHQQEIQFRNNTEIAKKYVGSYMMMLQFYGMKLKCKRTGELVRSRNPKYIQRYQKTLLTSFHNHMRITRILSSLVMIGFGRYAKQLSLFLKAEIYSTPGQMKNLKRYGVYQKQWKQFSQFEETESDLNIYLRELDQKQKH